MLAASAMLFFSLSWRRVEGLDNDVAPLPPLGWSSWNSLGEHYNETTIRAQADHMVASGMRDAGYEYINIDDLWAAKERAPNGSLVPDPAKFPSGLHALSSYIHNLGLKFGLYTDVGLRTCGGQPGSFEHECLDAQQFADWGVDWLKEDHCALPASASTDIDGFYNAKLATMRDCLNATGRPIFFDVCAHSCYNSVERKHSPACWRQWYKNATRLGNSWRTTTDISDNWNSVLRNWYRNDNYKSMLPLAPFNGPNQYNDPDSLVVGMGGLTASQERLHFSMWALMASPLIAGNRLDAMNNGTVEILTHPKLLKINQDPLVIQATRIGYSGAMTNFTDVYGDPLTRWAQEVWAKPLLLYPGRTYPTPYGFALALVNHGTANVTITADTVAITKAYPKFLPSSSAAKFDSQELWSGMPGQDVVVGDKISWEVEPDGVAVITLDPDC